MGQFQNLINQLIKSKLPEINSAISSEVKANNLDPLIHVESGTDVLGSVNLGICTAEAVANYDIANLTGLSSFKIDDMVIANATTSEDGSKMHGTMNLVGHMDSDFGIFLGGSFKAGCGFIKPTVGISGTIKVSNVTVQAIADFDATIGDKICITAIDVLRPALNFGDVNIHIDGLGAFNALLKPLEDLILGIIKGTVLALISSAMKAPINSAIGGIMPQCVDVT